MNFETNKTEVVEKFMTKIMPYIKANNSPENLEYVISFELQKFYDSAFVDGQMSILEVKK